MHRSLDPACEGLDLKDQLNQDLNKHKVGRFSQKVEQLDLWIERGLELNRKAELKN